MKKTIAIITTLMWLLLGGVAAGQTYSTADLLTVDSSTVQAGADVTVSGGGFAPGTTVTIVLVDNGAQQGFRRVAVETELATTKADDDGDIKAEVTIPDDFSGTGAIVARGQGVDGGTLELTANISNGSVVELPFTGTSSTSRWLVGAGVVAIAAGVGLLVFRDWHTSR